MLFKAERRRCGCPLISPIIVPLMAEAAIMEIQDVPAADAADTEVGKWSYRVALLLVVLNVIRPQDWVPGLAGLNIIRPVMLLWVIALMSEGLHSPLKGIFQTPHDWAMLIFFGYVVWNAPSGTDVGSAMFALVCFYFFTTQSLSSWSKLLGYLKLWNWLLLTLAVLGVLQIVGMDITHGKEITDYMGGRLALGTWTCDNPNSLGHTVVAALPLSYVLLFWRRGATARYILFPAAVAVVVACAFYTQSKGSYLVAAALILLGVVTGRPKWVQIIVLVAAITIGVGALSFLPRMESMGNLRSDEGVIGRLMAWELALDACEKNLTGAGWRQFQAWITVRDGSRWIVESKSTHSSYVQVGADLGKPGMFLWLLILMVNFRGILFFRSQNDTEERCRRAILLALTAYMISGWMINREYHIEYYLITAMAAAFHRLAAARALQPSETAPDDVAEDRQHAGFEWSLAMQKDMPWMPAEIRQIKPVWLRLDWIDLTIAGMMTWGTLSLWDYVIKNL